MPLFRNPPVRHAVLILGGLLLASALAFGLYSAALAVTLGRDASPLFLPQAVSDGRVAGMKLREIASPPSADTLVVLYSGDNGWAKADQGFAENLSKEGVAVVGVDSLRYFLKPRTAQHAADDLAVVIDRYSARWKIQRVILVGYSFGGSNLPAIVRRLPPAERDRVRLMALVAPGENANLTFDLPAWLDIPWFGATSAPADLAALRSVPSVCIMGDRDQTGACNRYPKGLIAAATVPADHRYKGAYRAVADVILARAGRS